VCADESEKTDEHEQEEPEPAQLLAEWIAENQPRISEAVLDALETLDEVAKAMTDSSLKDNAALRQRIHMILFASANLPDYMAEQFEAKFATETPVLREALQKQACLIARDQISDFIDPLIARHRKLGK
jgi:hypothetical protein